MNRVVGRGLVVCAVVVLLLAAGPVSAKNGFYVGGSFGQTTLKINDIDLDLEQFDYKADSTSYKIILGYRFMGFLAVEGSYIDFGTLSDSMETIEGNVRVENDLKGFDAFAMGMLPLGIVDIFAKVGFVSWDSDISAALGEIIELDTDSGTDLVYGIGAQVRFKGLAVRAELEYFDIADADSLYLISLGATFTF
jgi:OmpA-OmpF porin, OOP family